ncbi:response regulator [Isosphaeraceae bacterium EP7]
MERRGTILLVEDEAILRRLVAEYLRIERFVVVEAADGQEAIERYDDSGPFDVVLCDLNLPRRSGVEVSRWIKARCPSQGLIICSAAVQGEAEGMLRSVGVDRFLSKPFLPSELVRQVGAETSASRGRVARGIAGDLRLN